MCFAMPFQMRFHLASNLAARELFTLGKLRLQSGAVFFWAAKRDYAASGISTLHKEALGNALKRLQIARGAA